MSLSRPKTSSSPHNRFAVLLRQLQHRRVSDSPFSVLDSSRCDGTDSPAARLRIEAVPGATIGAVVHGIDVRTDLDDPETMRKVYEAFLDKAVLVFPGQHGLTTHELRVAFANRFGILDNHLSVSNIQNDGQMHTGTWGTQSVVSTDGWHTDMTFTPVTLKAGMLHAEVVPSSGGETEFADMRAGYDILDDAVKSRIEDMTTFHSLKYAILRGTGVLVPASRPMSDGAAKNGNVVGLRDVAYMRKLVNVHPETGRKVLMATQTAFATSGVSREESTKLLDDLCDQACQPPRTYKHPWKPGDLVIWDERSVFHRSRPWKHQAEPRLLHGLRTRSENTEESRSKLGKSEEILIEEIAWLQENKPWIGRRGTNGRGGWEEDTAVG